MTHEDTASIDPPSAVSTDFTDGGDLTLRSADGVNFSVHSLFLSAASPVFSHLLKAGNHNGIIRFSGNAEVLALMLEFIYPRPTPIITSMSLMNDAVRVANMYELDSMKTRLCEQLVLVASPVSVHANPFGALCVASTHGFTTEAELAAKIASEQFKFGIGEDLTKLVGATQGPATAALYLACKVFTLRNETLHLPKIYTCGDLFVRRVTSTPCNRATISYHRLALLLAYKVTL
ncbi:hypothetical protein FRC11_004694 [Ceratobasidium sp. 423]|nr:hypothetical protein FRC11_004694 [Ceratobasidium sp. 423]